MKNFRGKEKRGRDQHGAKQSRIACSLLSSWLNVVAAGNLKLDLGMLAVLLLQQVEWRDSTTTVTARLTEIYAATVAVKR